MLLWNQRCDVLLEIATVIATKIDPHLVGHIKCHDPATSVP
jgi:hypothetical protein